MYPQGPGRAPATPALTSLPRLEDLPVAERGYDPEKVQEAFDSFRRVATQLQAQLRVLQAAGRTAQEEPTGHALRMDALHLIREAAEFADTLERDAQSASASQFRRTEEEVRGRQRELQTRESQLERYRQESERLRAELINAAKNEARQLTTDAQRDASQELREAEARGARLLEQSRHQATELTNSARAEVEQTLEWARAQATAIMSRAQQGAEQLLTAAGLGEEAIGRVVEVIVNAAESEATSARTTGPAARQQVTPPEPPRVEAPPPPQEVPPQPVEEAAPETPPPAPPTRPQPAPPPAALPEPEAEPAVEPRPPWSPGSGSGPESIGESESDSDEPPGGER
jgi:vacuolar-type H+-ATPase subunit H